MQDRNKIYADLKRNPQPKINIGDRVLVSTHILSNKNKGLSSKFVPRRDGPYLVINKNGSNSFTVATIETPNIPLATYHTSDLTLYDGREENPVYPLRLRGRPKRNDLNKDNNQHAINTTSNKHDPAPEKEIQQTTTEKSPINDTKLPLRRSLRKRSRPEQT